MKTTSTPTAHTRIARPAGVNPPSVLFDRIESSHPSPIELTDDEYATLEAWLKSHRRRVRMFERQQAARGDSRVKAKLAAEDAWWNHVRFVAAYNHRLRDFARSPTTSKGPSFIALHDRVMRLMRDPAIADKRAMHVLGSLKVPAARLYCQHAEAGTPGFRPELCQLRHYGDAKLVVSKPVSVGNREITTHVPIPRGALDGDRPFLGLWNAIHLELSMRFPQRIRNPLTAGVTDKLTSDTAAVSARVVTNPISEWRQWAEDFAACLAVLAELAGETDRAQPRNGREVGATTSNDDEDTQLEEVALTQQEADVLTALAEHQGRSLPVVDIESKAGHSKAPTRNALERLEALGYIARPTGTQRKGYAITRTGLAFYKKRLARRIATSP